MDQPRRFGDRYELGGVLGRGGMAEVYQGQDIRLGRTVAVKTLRADLARDPTFQARFRREAQSAASLNHPSIVAVYDTGEDLINGLGIPYIVMEYVEGHTLRELLHSGRRLLPERALEITAGILQALAYSHANGIIHRDIKPANVMLTRSGGVKVMDFGIARALGDSGMTMTQTAAVIGTAQYLSPEQARGETVDARSDLYSTGCLLYELLVQRPPFVGDSPVSVAYQHVREEPVPPSALDPEISPVIDAVVLKSLAKDPNDRYQSADEMRADLERALDGQPVDAQTMLLNNPGAMAQTRAMTAMAPAAAAAPTTVNRPSGAYQSGGPPPSHHRGDDDGDGKSSKAGYWILAALCVIAIVVAFFVTRALTSHNSPAGAPTTTAPPAISTTAPPPSTSTQAQVPDVHGELYSQAVKDLQTAGFTNIVKANVNSTTQQGLVVSTNPAALSMADKSQQITVNVSIGQQTVPVPYVIGQADSQASAALTSAGFKVNEVHGTSYTEPQGYVYDQSPNSGQNLPQGSTVTIYVSNGQGNTSPSGSPSPTNSGPSSNPQPTNPGAEWCKNHPQSPLCSGLGGG